MTSIFSKFGGALQGFYAGWQGKPLNARKTPAAKLDATSTSAEPKPQSRLRTLVTNLKRFAPNKDAILGHSAGVMTGSRTFMEGLDLSRLLMTGVNGATEGWKKHEKLGRVPGLLLAIGGVVAWKRFPG